MLVDEHAYGNAAHVEAVQEVLDVLVGDGVHAEGLLVLHHALRHGGHHVVVPVADVHQRLGEAGGQRVFLGEMCAQQVALYFIFPAIFLQFANE